MMCVAGASVESPTAPQSSMEKLDLDSQGLSPNRMS